MIVKAFSIRDIKAGAFNPPFYKQTPGEAQRDFQTLVNDPKSTINQYPEDFQLWEIGTFDDASGVLTARQKNEHLCDATQLLRKVQ